MSSYEQLQKVDVTDTEPTAQVTGLENVLREDEIKDWDINEIKDSLKQAPDSEDNQVKVKRVL